MAKFCLEQNPIDHFHKLRRVFYSFVNLVASLWLKYYVEVRKVSWHWNKRKYFIAYSLLFFCYQKLPAPKVFVSLYVTILLLQLKCDDSQGISFQYATQFLRLISQNSVLYTCQNRMYDGKILYYVKNTPVCKDTQISPIKQCWFSFAALLQRILWLQGWQWSGKFLWRIKYC